MSQKLLRACVASCVFFAASAKSQTTNFWTGPNNGLWNDVANWSLGVVPNTAGATVSFPISSNATVNLTGFSATVGRLEAASGSANLVLGDTGQNSDIIVLDGGASKPVISITSGTTFIYANLQGTNGFTKSGGGTLTFRFNGADHDYTGDVELAGGTLAFQRDGSFGNANNDIIFTASSTLLNNSAGGAAVALGAGRTITINSGITATLQNNQAASPTIINGVVAGAGGIVFNGSAAPFTLNGLNTYTGSTILRSGARLTLGNGANISGATLFFDQSPGAVFNLGGNTQTVANVDANGVNAAGTTTLTNGSLTVNGNNDMFFGNAVNGAVWDLAGLNAFSFDRTNRNFTVRVTTTATTATNTLRLAATGPGTNTIKVSTMTVGGATGTSQGTAFSTVLQLGKANTINAGSFFIGGFNGEGLVSVVSGVTSPNLVLRGADGASAMTTMNVGETSSGARSGGGTLDFSGGTVDGLVTTMAIGRHIANANNGSTSTFSMGGGDLALTTLTLAQKSGTGTPALTAVFNQGGGTVAASVVTLGDDGGTGGGARLLPTFNLHGGTLRAATIQIGGGTFATNSVRTLSISNATLRNLAGADLTVASTNSTDAGRININLSGPATFEADAGRVVTIGANARISGPGSLTKTGIGTFALTGTSSYTGNTIVSEGVFRLSGSIASSSLTTINSGAALTGTGALGGASVAGILEPGSNLGDLNFGGSVLLESTSTLRMDIAGVNPGQFDRLVGTGVNSITFGGTLALNTMEYTPVVGNVVTLFDEWTEFLGAFHQVTGTDLGGGLYWDTTKLAWDGSITVVPEPSTMALLAIAGLAGALARWRCRRLRG